MAPLPLPPIAELRARYHAAAEALERVHLEELAALSDQDALQRTRSLKLFAPMPRTSSDWSGLVEQQALFHRFDRR
jgi:hypothetical protein